MCENRRARLLLPAVLGITSGVRVQECVIPASRVSMTVEEGGPPLVDRAVFGGERVPSEGRFP